ncbi:MAG: hypothetical protein GY751_20090 [Bacteroidetes bacterium]|nr:hypothetical protein [Bacteroidota bacterium]
MKAASLHQLKQELGEKTPAEVLKICLRLGRFKTENKELLTYILLESDDEESYIEHIKNSIDEQMDTINRSTVYYTKKGLRKVERYLNKWIRYSGLKATEAELRIYYCERIRESDIPIRRSKVMENLYNRQLDRIAKAISSLHADLQYDYKQELESLKPDC